MSSLSNKDSKGSLSLSSKLEGGEDRRSIFRHRAVKHYLEGREGEVLPRFVSPKNFSLLWVVFVVLVGGVAAGACLTKIPLYAPGTAVVAEGESKEDPSVVVFLPPEYTEELKQGEKQKLLLRLGSDSQRRSLAVNSVLPKLVSPEEAGNRFDLSGAQRRALKGQTVAAVAPLNELPQRQNDFSYSGKVYQAEVEVGSQRTVSLIPVVGNWFEEGSG